MPAVFVTEQLLHRSNVVTFREQMSLLGADTVMFAADDVPHLIGRESE